MNEELIRQAVADTVHCENYPSDGGFRTGQEDAAEAIRLYHARAVAPLERENEALKLLLNATEGMATDHAQEIMELRAKVAPLVEALEMMVEMVEMNGWGRDYAMDVARAALKAMEGE